MCLSIPSSPRSLCSTSSLIPKPSVPPIFKSCIQGGINVRNLSPFGMFVHYNRLIEKQSLKKFPPHCHFCQSSSILAASQEKLGLAQSLQAAWGLGAHETTERRKNPQELRTSWRATREKLRLPLPRPFLAPCPQYLNLTQGKPLHLCSCLKRLNEDHNILT